MSVTTTISLNSAEVYDEVGKITGYTGKKAAPDGTAYEVMATFGESSEVLGRFFLEACDSISYVLSRKLGGAPEVSEASYSATLNMPSNWNSDLSANLEGIAKTLVVDYVCAKWYRLCGSSDQETKYENDVTNAMMEMRKLINHASVPSRSLYVNG